MFSQAALKFLSQAMASLENFMLLLMFLTTIMNLKRSREGQYYRSRKLYLKPSTTIDQPKKQI